MSTTAYLRASYGFVRAQLRKLPASVVAIESNAREIEHGCAGSLAGAPEGAQLSALGTEVSRVLLFSSLKPDRAAMLRFAREIDPLRWRSSRLKVLVSGIAAAERFGARWRLPDACADIKLWVASGYRKLSPKTVTFLRQAEKLGEIKGTAKGKSPEETVLALIRPYENASGGRVAKRIGEVEEKLEVGVFGTLAKQLVKVTTTLGVAPEPG